ncbi:MAG: redoxin domain-containing protein [Chloroflexi bacterium]|nr:redoxin domain-containing protein [Chloroflexota bacterium]
MFAQDGTQFTYAGDTDAPDFPAGLDWINVSQPLTMADLKGKIVLLDFWTYGCVNCMHIIPELKQLETEFGDNLIVVGVHSAKFENEGQTDNIRNIVQRYGVVHPVVNDSDFVVWQTYGVQAWPTLVLIDPLGKIVGGRAGEGVYDVFQPILTTMVEEYGTANLLDATPLTQLAPEQAVAAPSALSYPGKVLADPAGNRLFISDTSHNRIVVADLDTFANVQVIGTGDAGLTDGSYSEAQFNQPQGLAIDGDNLFVADTVNHAVRKIDLAAQAVSTVTGTGKQAANYPPLAGNAPLLDLSSPWDVVFTDGVLYIAMAGSHQLWRIDLATDRVEPYAGTGGEGLTDGPLAEAELSQPSGLATDGTILYFADAEDSGIRAASLDPDGEVMTIVGTGLFDFGDVDGVGDEVRLEHALGVTIGPDGMLYVADTYNNKIKMINPQTRASVTFAGTGEPGLVDGKLLEAQFYEPGGINYADGKLYVADTNNHAIRVIDLASQTVSTVVFPDTTTLVPSNDAALTLDPNENPYALQNPVIELEAQTIAPGQGELVFAIEIPEGYKLNTLAPFTAETASTTTMEVPAESQDYRQIEPELPVSLPVNFVEGTDVVSTDFTVYWCEAVNETLCFVDRMTIQVPVTIDTTATNHAVVMSYILVPPTVQNGFK